MFSILIMLMGCCSFSFVSGQLASILDIKDYKMAKLQEKIETLDQIMKQYNLPRSIYIEVKRNLEYSANKDMNEVQTLIDELPHMLKMQFSLIVHEQKYNVIAFLKDKASVFISWLCPLLKPYVYEEN